NHTYVKTIAQTHPKAKIVTSIDISFSPPPSNSSLPKRIAIGMLLIIYPTTVI
ncbi:22987_t:CDS:1, partial [Dentiscutata erythropus]